MWGCGPPSFGESLPLINWEEVFFEGAFCHFLEGQGSYELFPHNGIKESCFLLKKQVSRYKLLNFKIFQYKLLNFKIFQRQIKGRFLSAL